MTIQNEQLQASMDLHRQKAELYEEQNALNEETRQQLVYSSNTAIANAVASFGSGVFERFVSTTGNDETADFTAAQPFRTVRAAVLSTPAGMRVDVKLQSEDGHPVFDVGATDIPVDGRHIFIIYEGRVVGSKGSNATLKFTTYTTAGDQTSTRCFTGNGLVAINGVTLKSDVVSDDIVAFGGWFKNDFLGLHVRLWDTTLECSRVPTFNSAVGDVFSISIVNSSIKKATEKSLIGLCDWNSTLSFVTGGGFSAEGEIAEYFPSRFGGSRFKWNRNFITGTL